MKIKKLAKLAVCLTAVGALLAGCGANKAADEGKKGTEEVRIGMLTHLNASEQKINEILKKVDVVPGSRAKLSRNYIYYDKLTAMQMGLDSGSIQEMSVYASVAKYLTDRNDKIAVVDHENGMKLSDSFCCAVRKDDTALKQELDKAIEGMRSDGTLDKLVKTYITDLKKDEEPPSVPMAKIDGAPTIKIAVTGDLPPFDLVLANGKAAGFNTAVLSELGKRTGKNVEIIYIDSAARASALSSKKVDVVFWATIPFGDSPIPKDADKPTGMELTLPYFSDKIVHVEKKK
ncbi:MAG: transporter substrate-binding domain-containing protein [Selenomonadaceae bacterium]|nr:transporter substrate-binding domain-containing protein [Selenomonadaceae bacterium]MBP3723227.1 transporter substrate-binding domain-containing protein [Selenomonadaceae bacterium]